MIELANVIINSNSGFFFLLCFLGQHGS